MNENHIPCDLVGLSGNFPESTVLNFFDTPLPLNLGRLVTALTNRAWHRWYQLISRNGSQKNNAASALSARKLPLGTMSLQGRNLKCEEAREEEAKHGKATCRLPTDRPRLSVISMVLVEALPSHKTHKKCPYWQKVIYFKEWTHTIMETGKFKICRVGWQGEGPAKRQGCS